MTPVFKHSQRVVGVFSLGSRSCIHIVLPERELPAKPVDDSVGGADFAPYPSTRRHRPSEQPSRTVGTTGQT
jgi:hypothetical protein